MRKNFSFDFFYWHSCLTNSSSNKFSANCVSTKQWTNHFLFNVGSKWTIQSECVQFPIKLREVNDPKSIYSNHCYLHIINCSPVCSFFLPCSLRLPFNNSWTMFNPTQVLPKSRIYKLTLVFHLFTTQALVNGCWCQRQAANHYNSSVNQLKNGHSCHYTRPLLMTQAHCSQL